jgi:ferric-dicitrate binding protein FerR (iron transport regulator)
VNCDEIQLLLPEYLVSAIRDPEVDWNEVGVHLEVCPACAEECRQTRWLIGLIRSNADLFAEHDECAPSSTPEAAACPSHLTVEEGWEDLKRRIPELAHLEKRQKRLTFFRRIRSAAAIAASLAVVVALGWMVLSNSQVQPPVAVLDTIQPKAFAERVISTGRESLPLGQPVTTSEERQEVLLGGMHRVVINTDTSVTFEAETIGGQVRYDLQLARGELYAEVVPGHAFTVKTPNARLMITGTKFDVRCDNHETDLILVKGSVRFSSLNSAERFVDVTAGHVSTVTGQSAPIPPRETDALAATAWVRDLALANAIARVQPDADLDLLDSIPDYRRQSKLLDLDSIDYVKWRDDHRDWFSRQFPWIFEIEKALLDRGLDTDYVTLLMISGDIWQFHYPQPSNGPIPVFAPAAVRRIATYYDVDGRELLKRANSSRDGITDMATQPDDAGERYAAAMHLWYSDIAAAVKQGMELPDDLVLFTLRAANYLTNTHTAAYLWMNTHPNLAEKLLADDKYTSTYLAGLLLRQLAGVESWLEYVAKRIATAQTVGTTTQELLTTPESADCRSQSAELRGRLSNVIATLVTEDTSKGVPTEEKLK